MPEIGKNIRRRRKELKMTQEELSLKMGYKSKTTIHKIEAGINDVVHANVIKFAEVLETTPAHLMGLEYENHNAPTNTDGLTERQRELYDFFSTVPDDKVDLILRVMKSIVEDDWLSYPSAQVLM